MSFWLSPFLLAFVLGLSIVSGCGAGDGGVCQDDGDCAAGLECCGETASLRGVCRAAGATLCGVASDTGVADAPPVDAPAEDAPVDAPAEDAPMSVDAAADDAPAPVDAGSDAGGTDAGDTTDAGADAGANDAGADAP